MALTGLHKLSKAPQKRILGAAQDALVGKRGEVFRLAIKTGMAAVLMLLPPMSRTATTKATDAEHVVPALYERSAACWAVVGCFKHVHGTRGAQKTLDLRAGSIISDLVQALSAAGFTEWRARSPSLAGRF